MAILNFINFFSLSREKKIFDNTDLQKIEEFQIMQQSQVTPWYIILLQLFGAIGSALFFCVFLLILGVFNKPLALLIAGSLLTIVALLLNLSQKNNFNFIKSLLLALFLTGQIMVYFAILWKGGNLNIFNWTVILTQPFLIFFFVSPFYAFIGVFGFCCALISEIFRLKSQEALPIFFLLLTGAWFFIEEFKPRILSYLYQRTSARQRGFSFEHFSVMLKAIRANLPIIILSSHFYNIAALRDAFLIQSWIIYVLLLGVALFCLILYLAKESDIDLNRFQIILIFLFCAALTTVSLQVSGILGSLILILYSWYRMRLYPLTLSFLYFVYYIFYFYYSLNLTLLQKSYLLLGIGGIFFLCYFILRRIYNISKSAKENEQ